MSDSFLKFVETDFFNDFKDNKGISNLIIAVILWIVIFLIGMFAGDLKKSGIIIWWLLALPIAFGLYYGSRHAILYIINKRKSGFEKLTDYGINLSKKGVNSLNRNLNKYG
jgi:hypothetical protein